MIYTFADGALARICCYVRILERVFNEGTRNRNRKIHDQPWTTDISKAITELTKLRKRGIEKEARELSKTIKANNESIRQIATATEKSERQQRIRERNFTDYG